MQTEQLSDHLLGGVGSVKSLDTLKGHHHCRKRTERILAAGRILEMSAKEAAAENKKAKKEKQWPYRITLLDPVQ